MSAEAIARVPRRDNYGDPYSAVEHISKIASGSSYDWREIGLVMLTTAFDASGAEDDLVCTVVAGFISTADEWIAFDRAWRARIGQDDLGDFRMSAFHAHRGPFTDESKWTRSTRDALIGDLIEIIIKHAFRKFGGAVPHPTLSGMRPDVREVNRITAYSLAGRMCAAEVSEWAKAEGFHRPIEYVFENGDKGKGKLIERFPIDDFPAPIFKPKYDAFDRNGVLIPGFTPLQAADIYAWELRNRITRLHANRRSFAAIDTIPGEARRTTEETFKLLCAGLVPPDDRLIVIPGAADL